MIIYQIKQQMESDEKSWMEAIDIDVNEVIITKRFEDTVVKHPDIYFELVKVETIETVIEFNETGEN